MPWEPVTRIRHPPLPPAIRVLHCTLGLDPPWWSRASARDQAAPAAAGGPGWPSSRKATVQHAEAPWEIDPQLQLTARTCAATLGPVRHGTLAIG